MRGIEWRRRSTPDDLSWVTPLHAQVAARRRDLRRNLEDLCLTIAAIPAPLLIAGVAWVTTIENRIPHTKGRPQGFRLTSLELQGAAALFVFVTAVYAVRTYYARIRERRADERAANPVEQARAAKNALAELSEFKSAVADMDRALTRLQEFRRDNLISAHRPIWLPRSTFGGDDRLTYNYQGHQRRFIDSCRTTLEHVAVMQKLAPLAAAHNPDVFNDDVMKALVDAEPLSRILKDRDILLEDAEELVALTSAAVFPITRDQPNDPKDVSGS
jgi:hypothetical protein